MAIQSLQDLQTSYGMDPVAVEIQFGRDAAFSESIFLKPLTSTARDAFEASVVGEKGKRNLANLRARLVADCWCSEAGEMIGTATQIGKQRADLVGAVFEQVRLMNGMDADVAVEEAGND